MEPIEDFKPTGERFLLDKRHGYECWGQWVSNGAWSPFLELYNSEDGSDWIADKDSIADACAFFRDWVADRRAK